MINLLLLLFTKTNTRRKAVKKNLSRSSSQDKRVREGDKTCNYSKANWDGISSTTKNVARVFENIFVISDREEVNLVHSKIKPN